MVREPLYDWVGVQKWLTGEPQKTTTGNRSVRMGITEAAVDDLSSDPTAGIEQKLLGETDIWLPGSTCDISKEGRRTTARAINKGI